MRVALGEAGGDLGGREIGDFRALEAGDGAAIVARAATLRQLEAGAGEEGVSRSVMDLWRIPSLRATFIAGGIIGSAQDLFQFYMPVYGHAVGLSASAIGTVLGAVIASNAGY